jgi:single-stranded DNA-binding protein
MADYSKIITTVTGYVTREPEIMQNPNGTQRVSLSIATNTYKKSKDVDGMFDKKTTYWKLTSFNQFFVKKMEANPLQVSDMVTATGFDLEPYAYTSKDGSTKVSINLVCQYLAKLPKEQAKSENVSVSVSNDSLNFEEKYTNKITDDNIPF